MSSLENLNNYFVEQRYPYGEPSGKFRLVTGVTEGKDGQPVKILADDLFSFSQALSYAENFRRNGIKPFEVE